MERKVGDATVAVGGTATITLLPTADVKDGHTPTVWFVNVSTNGRCSVQLRTSDNDVDMSSRLFLGRFNGTADSLIIPMGQWPWFVGTENDGIELIVQNLDSFTKLQAYVMVGVVQRNTRILDQRDQEILS